MTDKKTETDLERVQRERGDTLPGNARITTRGKLDRRARKRFEAGEFDDDMPTHPDKSYFE